MNQNPHPVSSLQYYLISNLKALSNHCQEKNMLQLASIRIPFLLILFLAFNSCDTTKQATGNTSSVTSTTLKPKNVIFLIGDGMGLPQITGAMYMNNNVTVFERFKSIGFHKSHSSDNLVTDSAAGATAFASGVKTYNGAIGVNEHKAS